MVAGLRGMFVFGALTLVGVGCGALPRGTSGAGTGASCPAFTTASCPAPEPVYADVAPIFQERCNGCHANPVSGPWPLSSYSDLKDWRDLVQVDLANCTMPPTGSNTGFTQDERAKILTWILCGLPQ